MRQVIQSPSARQAEARHSNRPPWLRIASSAVAFAEVRESWVPSAPPGPDRENFKKISISALRGFAMVAMVKK